MTIFEVLADICTGTWLRRSAANAESARSANEGSAKRLRRVVAAAVLIVFFAGVILLLVFFAPTPSAPLGLATSAAKTRS